MLSVLDCHSDNTTVCPPTADKRLDLMGSLSKLSDGNHHCYAVQVIVSWYHSVDRLNYVLLGVRTICIILLCAILLEKLRMIVEIG